MYFWGLDSGLFIYEFLYIAFSLKEWNVCLGNKRAKYLGYNYPLSSGILTRQEPKTSTAFIHSACENELHPFQLAYLYIIFVHLYIVCVDVSFSCVEAWCEMSGLAIHKPKCVFSKKKKGEEAEYIFVWLGWIRGEIVHELVKLWRTSPNFKTIGIRDLRDCSIGMMITRVTVQQQLGSHDGGEGDREEQEQI